MKRNRKGNTLAEMPAAMYFLFVGLLIPLIGLVTYGYRAALLYFCTRDACYKASKQTTFTLVQSTAATTWANDLKVFPGNAGTETAFIVVHPLTNTGDTVKQVPLPKTPAPDASNNVYFIRIVSNCQIQPMFGGSWLGMAVPGLNAPYNIQMSYQYVCENPQGLIN